MKCKAKKFKELRLQAMKVPPPPPTIFREDR